jgi:transposase
LPLDLLRTPRAKLQPLLPPRAARRALEQLVEQRRRLGGDTGRLTHRLTRPLTNSCPHLLPWGEDNATPRCCDFLAHWPPLQAAQVARRPPLERFFRAPHVPYTNLIDTPIPAIKNAIPLPADEGGSAPPARLVPALIAPLRGLLPARAAFDPAIAQRAQRHPACPLFAALPGAGAVLAPGRLVAFGAQRERAASAEARQTYAGIAPVPARSGKTPWGPWRWPGPTCLRQTFVQGAAESSRPSCGARAYYQQPRAQGSSPQAAVRALAFKWRRSLCRG